MKEKDRLEQYLFNHPTRTEAYIIWPGYPICDMYYTCGKRHVNIGTMGDRDRVVLQAICLHKEKEGKLLACIG